MNLIWRSDVSFLFCFSFLAAWFTDGRSLRHKYFKDYKDYLGKWGNVDTLNTCMINESVIAPICLTWWWFSPWQVPVLTMLATKNIITSTWDEVCRQRLEHNKNQRLLHNDHLFRQSLMFFVFSQIHLTSASASTITQPLTSAHYCSISSYDTWTKIRSDLFTRPTAATSSLQSPVLRPQSWSPLGDKHSQRNNWFFVFVFVSLSVKGWSRGCWWWSRGEENRVCTKAVYQTSLSLQSSPSLQLILILIYAQTYSRTLSTDKIKTMWPCYSFLSLLFSEGPCSDFLIWNLESFIDKWKNYSCSGCIFKWNPNVV